MVKEKDQEMIETLINKMFEIAGYDLKYSDIKDREDEWYNTYTMTPYQNIQWRDWGVAFIRQRYGKTKTVSISQMDWLDSTYGLRISQ